jgi:dihydrodipicolinate synthase/N-acetylneuraminate lyase
MRGERAPLVLFLGCKGAISYSKYDNGLDHFRRAGAAAVIAPAARVAPANVVKFVRDLAQALQKSLGGKSALIGQALRDARRLQFTQGNFPALSIMGFGDGDLRITLKE